MAIILQRFEKEELSTCQIRSDEDAEIRGLLSVREEMVSNKKSYKTKIIAMMEYWGIKTGDKMFNNFEKNTNWVKEQNIPESIKRAVIQMYVMLENLKEDIKVLDKETEALSIKRPGYNEIKELTGIGTTTGAYIITKVGNIDRFSTSKKFVSYMGLAPRVSESDGKGTNGQITRKVGNVKSFSHTCTRVISHPFHKSISHMLHKSFSHRRRQEWLLNLLIQILYSVRFSAQVINI